MTTEAKQEIDIINNCATHAEVEASLMKDEGARQNTYNSMKITKCPHVHRKHYAKNMCSSCYRKFGRNQLAWACEHTDKLNYSIGMCQTCYLSDYHKRRTQAAKLKKAKIAVSCETMSNASLDRINQEIIDEQAEAEDAGEQ